jgi:hypothetical protein
MSLSQSAASEQGDGVVFSSVDPERAADISIEIVITEIVHKHFGLTDVDCSPWIQKLRSNLVVNFGLLCRLDAKRLERLELPMLLEDELAKIIEEYQERNGLASRRPRREKRPKAAAVIKTADRGALLGLSDEMRASIKESWAYVTARNRDGSNAPALTHFFEYVPLAASFTPKQILLARIPTHLVVFKTDMTISVFYREFYRNFLNMDKVGRKLFEGTS